MEKSNVEMNLELKCNERKCGFEDCQKQVISCFSVSDGQEIKEYKFSCINHEKKILDQLRENYLLDRYVIYIADIPEPVK